MSKMLAALQSLSQKTVKVEESISPLQATPIEEKTQPDVVRPPNKLDKVIPPEVVLPEFSDPVVAKTNPVNIAEEDSQLIDQQNGYETTEEFVSDVEIGDLSSLTRLINGVEQLEHPIELMTEDHYSSLQEVLANNLEAAESLNLQQQAEIEQLELQLKIKTENLEALKTQVNSVETRQFAQTEINQMQKSISELQLQSQLLNQTLLQKDQEQVQSQQQLKAYQKEVLAESKQTQQIITRLEELIASQVIEPNKEDHEPSISTYEQESGEIENEPIEQEEQPKLEHKAEKPKKSHQLNSFESRLLERLEDPEFQPHYHVLAKNLQRITSQLNLKSLCLLDIDSSDQISQLVYQLGNLINKSEKKVLIIDLAISSGYLTKNLGYSKQAGVLETLLNEKNSLENVISLNDLGLDFLPTGQAIRSIPSDYQTNLDLLLHAGSDCYDLVLCCVDCQLTEFNESILTLFEGVFLHASFGKTNLDHLYQIKEHLTSLKVNLQGVIASQVPAWYDPN